MITLPNTTITADIPNHGVHSVTAAALDATIAKYLPTSTYDLRKVVERRSENKWNDVADMTTLLVVLADFDHNIDSSPLRRY